MLEVRVRMSIELVFTTVIFLFAVYGTVKTICDFKKGQVKFFSVFSHKPIKFKKHFFIATLLTIAQLILLIGYIVAYIAVVYLGK